MSGPGRGDLADLRLFLAIVRWGSFSKAAREMNLTASALSHAMRKLEARLGVRLLNRTSRAVTPTPAGVALAARLESGFAIIDDAVGDLEAARQYPIGQLRLNLPHDAAKLLIAPVLADFVTAYPRIALDLAVDDRLVDVIGEGFDAGIRYGERVPQDMIAVPLTPPLRWVIAGAPDLIARVGRPRQVDDLMALPCIRLRTGDGRIYVWELGDGPAMRRLDVQGPLCLNETEIVLAAARQGLGFAYCLEPIVSEDIAAGRLEVVLPEWASTGPPLCIYYPSRRQPPPGLRQLIDLVRVRHGLSPLSPARG